MIIKDLRGIESTQDACAKIRVGFMKTIHECKRLWFDKVLYLFETFCFIVLLQKSKDSRKGPVVILSITYRGVKFIDAATKVIDTSLCVCVCLCVLGKMLGDYWSVGRKVCLWSTQSALLSIWLSSVRLLWRSTRSGIFRVPLRIQMTSALLLTLPRIWRVATIFAMSLALWKWWVKYMYLFTHKIDMACIKIGQNCFCSVCLFFFLYKYWLDSVVSASHSTRLDCERVFCIPQLKLQAASFGHYYLD